MPRPSSRRRSFSSSRSRSRSPEPRHSRSEHETPDTHSKKRVREWSARKSLGNDDQRGRGRNSGRDENGEGVSGRWSPRGRRDESPGLGHPIFKSVVAHIGVIRQTQGPREKTDLIHALKDNGAKLCPNPTETWTTHIVIDIDPSYPRDVILPVDMISTERFHDVQNMGFWSNENLVRHLAHYVGTLPDTETRRRKVVLRKEWVAECIKAGRLLGKEVGYGGWEVRVTYENDHYAGPEPSRHNGPSTLRDRIGPSEGTQSPVDPRRVSRSNGPSSQVVVRQEPRAQDSGWQRDNGYEARGPPRETDSFSRSDRDRAFPAPNQEPSRSYASDRGPTPQGQQYVAMPTPASSVTSGFPAQGYAPEPVPVAAVGAVTASSAPDKMFTFGGVLPMGFHVEGSAAVKRSTEMVITRSGGGVIAPLNRASIIVAPLAKGEPATDPALLDIIQRLASSPSQTVVSQEWVFDCVEAERVLALGPYVVRDERAGAAAAVGGYAVAGRGATYESGQSNGNGAGYNGVSKHCMSLVEVSLIPVFQWTAPAAPSPAHPPPPGPPSSFIGLENVDAAYRVPMEMLIDRLRSWDRWSGWNGLIACLEITPVSHSLNIRRPTRSELTRTSKLQEEVLAGDQQLTYVQDMLRSYGDVIERNVSGLNVGAVWRLWTENVRVQQ
ncbi:hypothetical protein IAT38_005877 [Cryptococcus sp. DSM 104549]